MEFNNSRVTIGIIAFIAFGLMLFLILPFSEQSSTIIIDRPSSGNVTFNATLALDDLTDVIIISPVTNQTLIYNGVNWVNADIVLQSGDGNDTTSCNNLGSGVIICSGGNVNLKSLMEGNGIDLGFNSTNIQISNDGVINNIAGNGISVNQSSGNVLITNTEPEDTLCIIQPTGIGLCVNEDVELKNLVAGSGIGITTNTTHITFTNTRNVVNGTDGEDGEDGEDGINGIDGEDGTDGVNGLNGTNGIDGIDGQDGVNGTNGANGINGTNGIDGANGINGINGTNGIDGQDGINGTNAFTSTVNLGNGANVFKNITDSVVYFKTLLAGSGISVTNGTDTITFTNTGVISNTATSPIVVSGATGTVNISCPTCIVSSSPVAQYEKLCQTVLGSSNATISCDFAGNGKRHLLITGEIRVTGGTGIEPAFRFNSDSGTNYGFSTSKQTASFTSTLDTTRCNMGETAANLFSSGSGLFFSMWVYNNQAGDRKLSTASGMSNILTDDTTAPLQFETTCKWDNTASQITRVTFHVQSGTGSYNTNSIVTVWGYD